MTLEVRSLTVRFPGPSRRDPEVTVLDTVDLTVPTGRIVSVLGPSGSGKSTLLRAVTGLVRPTAGTVHWDGQDLTTVPPDRRGFGLMFQDHALFPHRDVAANIAYGLEMKGLDRRTVASRVAAMLDLVGLDDRAGARIDQLSGGEQQRIALARALAPEPRLLLLDEPLGALDRVLRDRLVNDLARMLRQVGTTVVYVTHDQDEALAIADHLVILRRGRIEQEGPTEEVWRRPRSEFVGRFLGMTNTFPGRIVGGRIDLGWTTLDAGDHSRAGEGNPVTVMFRPAAVVVEGPEGPGPRAVLRQRQIRGDRIQGVFGVGPGDDVVHVDLGLATEPAVGDTVTLMIDPAQVATAPCP
ncbi:MAG TPA: ABC transporter ATP-binding protein [Acidimicrobiales bacterium]|nr:ABC transporter ATP-binding protein [Acidimicrobiales bacterium]